MTVCKDGEVGGGGGWGVAVFAIHNKLKSEIFNDKKVLKKIISLS